MRISWAPGSPRWHLPPATRRVAICKGPLPHLSYHVQFESRLSLTGSKADQRLCLAPGEMGLVMTQLAARVAKKAGLDWGGADLGASPVPARFLDDLADRLWNARGRCLVLCGSQDLAQQLVCNFLNHLLQNYGATLDVANPSYQNQSNDGELHELLEEIRQGQVGALFCLSQQSALRFAGRTGFDREVCAACRSW